MYMTYRAAKYLVDARGHCQLSVRSLQDGVLGAAAACPCVGPPSESALGANGGTAEAPGGSMMRMGGAPSHPDGESLVNLTEWCLHFRQTTVAAAMLSDDESRRAVPRERQSCAGRKDRSAMLMIRDCQYTIVFERGCWPARCRSPKPRPSWQSRLRSRPAPATRGTSRPLASRATMVRCASLRSIGIALE